MDAKALSEVMGGALSLEEYERLLPGYVNAAKAAGINTVERAAMWAAQLGHESGGLRWMREQNWNKAWQSDADYFARYDNRKDLGNGPGDGLPFRGAGPIQLTGRAHFRNFTKWAQEHGHTDLDFEANPDLLSEPHWGFLAATYYWTVSRPHINDLSDACDVEEVTRAINGGLNGFDDRLERYQRAMNMGGRVLPSGGVMKDWAKLQPDKIKLLGKHFTPGRGGQKIDKVVIHHTAGVLTTEQVWGVWQSRAASAHYIVETSGQIGQLVWDRDTAWHAANLNINQTSIGIEHSNSGGPGEDWPINETTLEEGAHLVAAICRYYELGRPQVGKNVRFHREFAGTSCPYHLAPGGKYHDNYIRRAQFWYDEMGKPSVPVTSSSSINVKKEGVFMALNDDEQRELLDHMRYVRGQLGPWPQLGKNADGQDLTLVDAVSAVRHALVEVADKINAVINLFRGKK